MTDRVGPTDVGTQVLHRIFKNLQIDEEWSKWDERAFTWWPHRLAQRVSATELVDSMGFEVSTVTIETDLAICDEARFLSNLDPLSRAARRAALSSFGWDGDRLTLQSSMEVHDENIPFASRLLEMAALDHLELSESFPSEFPLLAMSIAVSGDRREPDDMIGAIAGLPGRGEPSRWSDFPWEPLLAMFRNAGFTITGGTGEVMIKLTASDGGVSRDEIHISSRTAHQRMGSGLMIEYRPADPLLLDGATTHPLSLNKLEEIGGCPANRLGSWAPGDSEDSPPVYTMFVPSILASPESFANLVMSMILRSQWVMSGGFANLEIDEDEDGSREVEDADGEGVPASPGATSEIMQMLIEVMFQHFHRGAPLDPRFRPLVDQVASQVEPGYRSGAEASPLLRSWIALERAQFLVEDIVPALRGGEPSAEFLEAAEEASDQLRDLGLAIVPLARAKDAPPPVLMGGFVIIMLQQALSAVVALARGLPTPTTTRDLIEIREVEVPAFSSRQEAADFWSQRVLQAHAMARSLSDLRG